MPSSPRLFQTSLANQPLVVALGATLLVTALSYLMPESLAATAVGVAFLGVTYALVLRTDDVPLIRRCGLSLGGVFEPAPLSWPRVRSSTGTALFWAGLLALLFFPPFWFGFVRWWNIRVPFRPAPLGALGAELLGNALVIALPEEAFYRGYLQSALDNRWQPRWRVLGATVGPGLFVASAVFALGHLLTEFHPNRLAVFFPALVFGWLRARTGGIGASVLFHTFCNLFALYLAQSYGFGR